MMGKVQSVAAGQLLNMEGKSERAIRYSETGANAQSLPPDSNKLKMVLATSVRHVTVSSQRREDDDARPI